MAYFGRFYLDREKDLIITLDLTDGQMTYLLQTPNHRTGNLITNLARLCHLPLSLDENGLKVIRGPVPCYVDAANRRVYILHLGSTKIANIDPDGTIERKASIPAISKTLMSQTKDYRLDYKKTIVKTFIRDECKFRSDLHTHMNGNLAPDTLIALGIAHQIRYPLYYIRKLDLRLSDRQRAQLLERRETAAASCTDPSLTGKYRDRWIDDRTFINLADLICGNVGDSAFNLSQIRNSLAVPKDGQAVFADLEKVYIYRYVFTRGLPYAGEDPLLACPDGAGHAEGADNLRSTDHATSAGIAMSTDHAAGADIPEEGRIVSINPDQIPDEDIARTVRQILADHQDPRYQHFTLFQDKLLWIARRYRRCGITYAEISDTTLVKAQAAPGMLRLLHEAMPAITEETGVHLRFLAAIRRIPLSFGPDRSELYSHLQENLQVLRTVAADPYVAGSDIVGEEINDIRELSDVIRSITSIARTVPGFVIRIHAGENDSLPDNVAHALECVVSSLAPGQAMPALRIGHGLYTANLRSKKGRQLIHDLKEYGVTLEFQISSNVRLNNLSDLSRHPIKSYLQAGICCVQGTDGGGLYGTHSIDEQLSLEKMLDLSYDQLLQMRAAEERCIRAGLDSFRSKSAHLVAELLRYSQTTTFESPAIAAGNTVTFAPELIEAYYQSLMPGSTDTAAAAPSSGRAKHRFVSASSLPLQISTLPQDKVPLILMGGSFNNDRRVTRLHPGACALIDRLLEQADPQRVFFVVGHRMCAYEKYLADHNHGRFLIVAFVPSVLSPAEKNRLQKSGVHIRISSEVLGTGLYKSYYDEIFKCRPSVLVAFDGNSAGLNIIQDARNSRSPRKHQRACDIYLYGRSRTLSLKARSLQGYVRVFTDDDGTAGLILESLSRRMT